MKGKAENESRRLYISTTCFPENWVLSYLRQIFSKIWMSSKLLITWTVWLLKEE